MTYKIGTRVRVVDSPYLHPDRQNGVTGEIISIIKDGECYGVRLDVGRPDDRTGQGWGFFPDQIEPLDKLLSEVSREAV